MRRLRFALAVLLLTVLALTLATLAPARDVPPRLETPVLRPCGVLEVYASGQAAVYDPARLVSPAPSTAVCEVPR